MLVSVFATQDNRFFLYVPFSAAADVSKLELPETIAEKFKKARFCMHVNTAKNKLAQVQDLDGFKKQLEETGYYIVSLDLEQFDQRMAQQVGNA